MCVCVCVCACVCVCVCVVLESAIEIVATNSALGVIKTILVEFPVRQCEPKRSLGGAAKKGRGGEGKERQQTKLEIGCLLWICRSFLLILSRDLKFEMK